MAILDVVRFNGLRDRDWIVYRYPAEGIVWGSQVIVQEGQVAVFVKGGEVYDVMYPGTYTLESMNLPLLHRIVNIPFGGRTPFSAEIYFINTATKLDIYWGTSDPIKLIDPKYFVKLNIRAFGQMGLKLKTEGYVSFLTELIGGMNLFDIVKYDKIKEFYKGLIVIKVKSIIAETIIHDKISALEISTKLEDISAKTKERISQEFEKYGFHVVNFYVQSINFPDEDFQKINAILEGKAEFEIMGDSRYATKRSFDVYETAAGNENGTAGAFAAAGMGAGLGMGMAGGVNRNVNSLDTSSNTVYCSKCHEKIDAGSKFCSICGKPVSAAKSQCPQCGEIMEADKKFCSQCGCNLQKRKCECGNEIDHGEKFCSECGKAVN